jgi:hypothetical protein
MLGLIAVGVGVLGVTAFGPQGRLDAASSPLVSKKDSHALVADILSIDAGFPSSASLGEVTIGAEAVGGKPLFIGYGTREAVDKYLDGVGFDAVSQAGSQWQTKSVPGGPPPDPPGDEKFWLGSSSGFDTEVRFAIPSSGEASVVIMNMDGGAPVKARIAIGYQSDVVFPASLAAIVVGSVMVLVGILLLRRRRGDVTPASAAPAYPTSAEVAGEAHPVDTADATSSTGTGSATETGAADAADAAGPDGGETAPQAPAPGTDGGEAGQGVPSDWYRRGAGA